MIGNQATLIKIQKINWKSENPFFREFLAYGTCACVIILRIPVHY